MEKADPRYPETGWYLPEGRIEMDSVLSLFPSDSIQTVCLHYVRPVDKGVEGKRFRLKESIFVQRESILCPLLSVNYHFLKKKKSRPSNFL